jgi:hypothetical protein
MTAMDVVKVAGAIMASIGGAGAMIFGFSSFLGKLWADRALEEHRHKYATLSQQMQHDLDNASKRLQMELDTIGLVHSIRTKEEFGRLAALWKMLANLSSAFNAISGPKEYMGPGYEKDWREYQGAKALANFEKAARDAQQFFFEEMIFIPERIAKVAGHTLSFPFSILNFLDNGVNQHLHTEFGDIVRKLLRNFEDSRSELEQLIRMHIRGESLGETSNHHIPLDDQDEDV